MHWVFKHRRWFDAREPAVKVRRPFRYMAGTSDRLIVYDLRDRNVTQAVSFVNRVDNSTTHRYLLVSLNSFIAIGLAYQMMSFWRGSHHELQCGACTVMFLGVRCPEIPACHKCGLEANTICPPYLLCKDCAKVARLNMKLK